jgi:hypothetical protein
LVYAFIWSSLAFKLNCAAILDDEETDSSDDGLDRLEAMLKGSNKIALNVPAKQSAVPAPASSVPAKVVAAPVQQRKKI